MATSLMLLLPPIVRAGLQSGTIMATADLFTQTAIEKQQQQLDFRRTGRWAVAGLLIHGPYFYAGFRRLDGYFGAATSWKIVAQKTAAAQCLLFPPYLVVLFAYFGWTEQPQDCYGWHDGIFQKVRRCVPAAFMGGCVFWPVANVLNFGWVPAAWRVPYLAASAGVWNSYLSWSNSHSSTSRHQTSNPAKDNDDDNNNKKD